MRRIARFEDPDTPYVSWAAPQFMGAFGGDYDHLARVREWAVLPAPARRAGNDAPLDPRAVDPQTGPPIPRRRPSSRPTPARARPRPWWTGSRGFCCGGPIRAASSASPTPRRPPPRCRAACSSGWAAGRCARTRASRGSWAARGPAAGELRRRGAEAGAGPVRARAGDAGRAEDPDHPRLLREAAQALPAGGGRLARASRCWRTPRPRRCRPGRATRVALFAANNEDGPLGRAFAHFAVELDPLAWEGLFGLIEAKRAELTAYAEACAEGRAWDPWTLCGAERGVEPEAVEAQGLARLDRGEMGLGAGGPGRGLRRPTPRSRP